MSRKTNRYKHFGVEFSSSKPSVINLESFTEKAQRPRSDYLFWLLTCNGEYRLFDKDSMVEHFTHILDEIDSIKSKGPKNGKFVEDTCKEVLAFFKKDYKEEQYAKRKEIYEKENLEKDYGCIEKFIDNLPNVFERWKSNYDFSNGSYYRPYLAEKNVLRQDENLKKTLK